MDREQYIDMRNSGRLDGQLLYNYFRGKGGDLPPHIFQTALQMLGNLQGITSHLDKEFSVNILSDKNQNFIKCY